MGCWELDLNLSLHAQGCASLDYIFRAHIMNAHCLVCAAVFENLSYIDVFSRSLHT